MSPSIYRLQDWVGGASDSTQDRGTHLEEERAGKGSVGTGEQDGLAGKGKEAEFERGGPVSGIAVPHAAPNPRCPCVGIS